VIRNNLLALVVHGAIVVVSIAWLMQSSTGMAGAPVAVALYVAAGFAYRDQGTPLRNLVSLVAPAALAILALALAPFGASGVGDFGGLGYAIANFVFASAMPSGTAASGRNGLALVLAFGPTLFFWAGLELKVWWGKARRHGEGQAAANDQKDSQE
jgi:hypothetical protein